MTEVWESFSHLSENVFFNLGLLLIVGMIGGNITERFHLPRVTGYIIVGMIFGPHGLGFFGRELWNYGLRGTSVDGMSSCMILKSLKY